MDSSVCCPLQFPPLISFKRDKTENALVRSAFQTSDVTGKIKCARAQCKTCPFIRHVEKISGPGLSQHLPHNLYSLQKSYTSAKQGNDQATDSENTFLT